MSSSRLAVAAAVCAAVLATPAAALAVPPANDNYLASTIVTNSEAGTLPSEWDDPAPPNTLEATTQADLFNPDQNGAPGSGGGPEPLTCGGAAIGRTVWYDLTPPTWGGVELTASGPFDVAVGVYKWDPNTSRITKTVTCQNSDASTTEDVLFNVARGSHYTVQVAGVNGAGGQIAFKVLYFRDTDHDGTLDAQPDECRLVPGTRSNGCPPELQSIPRYGFSQTDPVVFTKLNVDTVPKGGKVEVSCKHCGHKVTVKAHHTGTVHVKKFLSRRLPTGDKIVFRVTRGPTGKGKFKFGAIGKYISYDVTKGGLDHRVVRCLNPGSRKPVTCK
jgi:ribosomal protein S27E